MFGKRGENPPLPSNCKRRFCGCTKPLPKKGGKAQPLGSTSQVRRPVPPSSQSALSRAKEDLHVRFGGKSLTIRSVVDCSAVFVRFDFIRSVEWKPARKSCGYSRDPYTGCDRHASSGK